ncbi:MAG: glucose-6-phosphate isomerase [Peptococcaceae bacterium]|jgi:glucose-6-phosphate isomerase|nr:glucose-6-phosphate isomerase [Peptococcaceae bacterium]MDH7524699.1 glucose-6-phosphate isomerase [Peptococcaceae bacterium]
MMDKHSGWKRFQEYCFCYPEIGLSLDLSRMFFPDGFINEMEPAFKKAFHEMAALEAGAISNPDENRMVGHYWLRDPRLAPSREISCEIEGNTREIKRFASEVGQGVIRPGKERIFRNFVLIGIGGSALGPQLLADALWDGGFLKPYFLDNTDADGIDLLLKKLRDKLEETLVLVVSKSGGTVETYNGMLEIRHAYLEKGLDFAKHAVAVTMAGSKLDQLASGEGWLARFPLWDWVGGRFSITSTVGLLPAALLGIDIDSFLEGARLCDRVTRKPDVCSNPAALLAAMWYYAADGRGKRDMVVLPYKDRLQYLARYLQQLVMESLGKELDRGGVRVNQGLTVYGNKGSTDQHAYVQQLLDGVNNFFVTFIEVLSDNRKKHVVIEKNVTSGDYLRAFLLGTRQALTRKGRESITITIKKADPFHLGALLAVFERTVGFYASLVNVNAYHQPGVELGKKGAGVVIEMLIKIYSYLHEKPGEARTVGEIAQAIGFPFEEETVYKILEFLAAQEERGIKKTPGDGLFDCGYFV